MPDPRETPAMQQYYRFKKRHPGCVLFFRIGDFYEMFDDDAVLVSKAIGLTLTQRTAGVPMCGVPHHQLETYLKKLIDKSFRVAVCEQIEPSETAKGLVARAVTRVLTSMARCSRTRRRSSSPPSFSPAAATTRPPRSRSSMPPPASSRSPPPAA